MTFCTNLVFNIKHMDVFGATFNAHIFFRVTTSFRGSSSRTLKLAHTDSSKFRTFFTYRELEDDQTPTKNDSSAEKFQTNCTSIMNFVVGSMLILLPYRLTSNQFIQIKIYFYEE